MYLYAVTLHQEDTDPLESRTHHYYPSQKAARRAIARKKRETGMCGTITRVDVGLPTHALHKQISDPAWIDQQPRVVV